MRQWERDQTRRTTGIAVGGAVPELAVKSKESLAACSTTNSPRPGEPMTLGADFALRSALPAADVATCGIDASCVLQSCADWPLI